VAAQAGGLEAWRRSLPWWDGYFAVVLLGTIALVLGDPLAVASLLAMAMWYPAFGRRLVRSPGTLRQCAIYLGVAALLMTGGLIAESGVSFILFALTPHAQMMLSFRLAAVATLVLNLTPAVVQAAQGENYLPVLLIGLLATVMANVIGFSINKILDQSTELAASRAEVARLSREAERRRLGADLHDTVAQGLSSLVMLVQAADAALDRDPAQSRRHLELAARTARDNLREVRAVLDALLPSGEDLPEALRRLAMRFTEETGTEAAVSVAGQPRPLAVATEVVLLRAAQESLANVRRHAAAGSVTILLTYAGDAVSLGIRDDGRGFHPGKTVAGHGLAAMRSRVTEAGGSFDITPTPQGTLVRVAVPA
jgi:signal transduction histidine kinase